MSIVLMQPIQASLRTVMFHVRDEFIKNLEDLVKMEIVYSSMRPSFFGSLDLKNLRFIKDENNLLTISQVRIHFSIPELLLRRKTFIHTIQIDQPVFLIDAHRDKETLEYLVSLFRTEYTILERLKSISEFIPKNVDYLIRQCKMIITDDNKIYNIDGMNVNIWGNDDEIFLAGRLFAEYINTNMFERTVILNTDIGINAASTRSLDDGKFDFTLYYMIGSENEETTGTAKSASAVPVFTVNPVKISILYKDHIVSLKSDDSTFNTYTSTDENTGPWGNYLFQYNLENGDLFTEINLNEYLLYDIISFSNHWNSANHLLQTQITGNAFFKNVNNNMDYNVKVSGRNQLFLASDYFNIDFNGNEKKLNLNDFRVNLSANTAQAGLFQGDIRSSGSIELSPFKPDGTIVINQFNIVGNNSKNENLSAVFNVKSRENEINISSRTVSIAQTQLNNMNINLYHSINDLAVSFSTFYNNEGAIYLDAIYNYNPKEMEASLSLASVSFLDISETIRPFIDYIGVTPLNNTLDDSLLSADIFFSTDFNNVVFNAPNIMFNTGSSNGMFSITATDRQLSLSSGILSIDENEYNYSASITYSDPLDIGFAVNLSHLDFSWQIEGQFFDRRTLIVRDPNGLSIYGNVANNGVVSGYIEGIDYPIHVNNQVMYFNFFTDLRYTSSSLWNLNMDYITARDQNSSAGNEFFKISGRANQNGAEFRELVYIDTAGTLEGTADILWDKNFSYFEFSVNIKDIQESGEYYNLEGVVENEQIKISASVSNMQVNRFLKESTPIMITAQAELSWDSIDSFKLDLNIGSFFSIMPENYIRGSVGINIDNNELLVNNLNLDISGLRTILPELKIDCLDGKATAQARLIGLAFERRMEADVNLNIAFEPINSWLYFRNALNNFDGSLKIENINYNNLRQDPFNFIFAGNNGAISVSGGIRDMIRLEMDNNGNFFAGLSAPFPIRGSIVGTFKDWHLDAKCSNFYFDLAALWDLTARVADFNISSGYITGSMDIRGPVWNPEFYGNARGSSFRFQVPNYVSEDLRPVPFAIFAQGYEMTFGPVVTAIGSGGATINGWFLFESWKPVNIGLDISVPNDKPVPYDINIFGFLANGNASGNMKLNVDSINSTLEFTGDLFTNNAELGLNMEEMGGTSDDAEPDIYALVNLKITVGSSVEFAWPGTSPILRANPEMGTVIHVSADNRAGQFSLNSDVKIRSGELYYFDRSFYIRQGNLVFRENERQFDPRFSVRAEIRDRADTGPVTISMIVENQPLLRFEPRFEASPSLSQLEIYSILGHNFNSIQGMEDASFAQRFLLTSTTDLLTQFVATSEVFSQFVFFRQIERQVRDFLGLDMFSVRTRFLQNAVIFGAAGDFVQTTDDIMRGNRFGNYFDNTTVFVGKYIGHDMFIQGMLTMRYDENSTSFSGLRFDPDIGIELQSPFVSIRWDFFPYHPENLWVNDNSITLSWSRSF